MSPTPCKNQLLKVYSSTHCFILHSNDIDLLSGTAVPFEEDDKDTSIWFLDHNYHEQMFSMFKKINGKIVAPSHPSLHALCCGRILAFCLVDYLKVSIWLLAVFDDIFEADKLVNESDLCVPFSCPKP
jgi:hypothetical protein